MSNAIRQFATALYGRTSKDDPKRVTIEIQQQTLREWALRDPLVSSLVGEYWDDGVTGKLPLWERPEGRRLLEDVRAGRIESVAVAYSDRFGRTLLDGLQGVKALEDQGVKLVAVNDGWDARRNDSPLYFQFRMMMAEEEHRRILKRMTDGKLRAMERDGAPPGGPLTFGYTSDAHGRFVMSPVEAPVVIRIFEMALEGYSNQKILAWVLTQGVPAGRKQQKRAPGSLPQVVRGQEGARWHLTKIGRILRDRTYLGERKWGGRVFPCPALVDQETFDRVQLACQDRSRPLGTRGHLDKSLLSGMLICAACGEPYYFRANCVRRKDGRMDRYRRYLCDGFRRGKGCRAKALPADETDEDVWGIVKEYLSNPEELVRKVIAADQQLGAGLADLDAAESRCEAVLAAIEEEVRQVWDEQRANGWPTAWVAPRLNELKARRDGVCAEQAELRRRKATVQLDRDQTEAVVSIVGRIRRRLSENLTAEEKAEIVRAVLAGGVVHTTGMGKGRTAEVTILVRWGDLLAPDQPACCPKLPSEQCHGMVHATYTNRTLEAMYPTIEQLRKAPELAGFLRWVRKQPPTRRTRNKPRRRKI
jgi:site-specific DNA recombinase